ncbi:MAG: molybdopterin molybdotransferase MoeA [Desulfobacterales bacterium]|nr:molybdopterin molybdotransferase MoeA [Desulfobacterales bacterium]
MISFEQARHLIERNIPRLRKKTVKIQHALGFVLAENVRAPIDLPVADNSAMDGFVLRSAETRHARSGKPVSFRIRGDIKAGDKQNRRVKKHEACRIMTGAFIPKGADTVIPKEEAIVKGDSLVIDQCIPAGRHIRYQGEEIARGRKVLDKGSLIHPATVGVLAMLGKDQVTVFDRPKVSLITTGNELVKPGSSLRPGQIYDSNSWMIQSALENMGIPPLRVSRVKDSRGKLGSAADTALKQSDILILMGGVSVGKYDYVKDILKEAGVRKVFWKVSQKPGKPLYFGRKGQTIVFGLPGNPASVFTCFYEYVFPALRRMSGFRGSYPHRELARIRTAVKPDQKKTLFLKAKITINGKGKTVIPLGRQSSHMISSLQDANCFIAIPPSRRTVRKGQRVRVDLLPARNGDL